MIFALLLGILIGVYGHYAYIRLSGTWFKRYQHVDNSKSFKEIADIIEKKGR